MGLNELIIHFMVYIASVSGGFSEELKYDSTLYDSSAYGLPKVHYANSERLYLLMYNRTMPRDLDVTVAAVQFGRSIYLENNWDITKISDQSELLHELVHYMQHETGLHYDCPGDKERLAYYIQEKWLYEIHGISLYEGANVSPLVMVMGMYCPLPETFAKNGEGGP